jgi:hypothetical protein
MAIARAIVDKDWRQTFVGPGSDMARAVRQANYPVTDQELELLRCNTLESFDERYVSIDNWEELWQQSEQRVHRIVQ